MKTMQSFFAKHATPITLHCRASHKENQPHNGTPEIIPGRTSRTSKSVVRDYGLEELIDKIKLSKEDDHHQNTTNNSQNTLFDEFCKASAGKPRRQHAKDSGKITKINELLYELKEQSSCQQKMPIVQNLLSRICGLLEQDSCHQISMLKQSNQSDHSLFQQLGMATVDPNELNKAIKKMVTPELLERIDSQAVYKEVCKLETESCRMRLFQ